MPLSPPSQSLSRRVPFVLSVLVLFGGAAIFFWRIVNLTAPYAARSFTNRSVDSVFIDIPALSSTQTRSPSAFITNAPVSADGEAPAYIAIIREAASLFPEQRNTVLAALFSGWAKDDCAAAANAALTLKESEGRDLAWFAVVHQWVSTDPISLSHYACNLPAGPIQRMAMEAGLCRWLERDLQSALAWAARLPSAPENDKTIALVAMQPSLVASEPELALDWAESIHDPALRSHAVGAVIRQWRVIAPETAMLYAQNSPDLTAQERNNIAYDERLSVHP